MAAMNTSRLNRDLALAVDLFVMTKFQECFDECRDVIAVSKMEAEQERNDVIIEAATALGIQALAEIDKWMETTSFITGVYGNVDLCPPRIIQICILLHAHVREYLPCHGMVQAWLRNPHNLSLKQCGQVIRVYATHVLCPTGCQDMVKEVVDKCVSLTQSEKLVLLQQSLSKVSSIECETIRRVSVTSDCEEHSTDGFYHQSSHDYSSMLSPPQAENPAPLNENWMDDPISWFQARAIEGFQCLCQFVTEKSSILQNSHVRLFVMGVIAVLALIQTQSGDVVSSLGRFVVLWRGFLQRLAAMLKLNSR